MKTKSLTECEEHYYAFYNKSKEDFLPQEDDYIINQRFASQPTAAGSLRNSQSIDSNGAAALDESK